MLLTVRLGFNDREKARAFYDASFGALGLPPGEEMEGRPVLLYSLTGGPRFLLGPARDGKPATHANGGTLVFAATSVEAVKAWHAAGLANGGSDAGAPEPKLAAGGAFGAYLRDPDGNKLGCYHGLSFGN